MTSEADKDDHIAQSHGTPVSRYVIVPSEQQFDFVRHALSMIDSVHGDGELTPVSVVQGSRRIGSYTTIREGSVTRIEVATQPDRRVLSFVHEIGHFLDHQALGKRSSYASESGRMRSLMRAIDQSMSVYGLKGRTQQKHITVTDIRGNRLRFPVNQRDVAYLLEPKERFARVYAQYITLRSQDETMLAQLNSKRRDSLTQGGILSAMDG